MDWVMYYYDFYLPHCTISEGIFKKSRTRNYKSDIFAECKLTWNIFECEKNTFNAFLNYILDISMRII